VSVAERWARAQEQVERMHVARHQGGRCAWCGREFRVDEPVYIDLFLIRERRRRPDEPVIHQTTAYAPVGAECASPELLEATAGRAPKPCANCGRGVYSRMPRRQPQRSVCSRRCASYATMARRR
jgi:hypothetical protein